MLLILMYHRAGDRAAGAGNSPAVLAGHFQYLRDHAAVIWPGEKLQPRRLNVCLTFDDAYADFYFRVFPLLQKFSLRAVLAVPTRFILEATGLPPETRLAASQAEAMSGEVFQSRAPFCTWQELRRMNDSGLVRMASHSHTHPDMRQNGTDVEFEAAHSQALLDKNLGGHASAFVYPYGSVNARARQAVRRHYEFDLRVGSALNPSWQPARQPLCRVPADDTPDLAALLRWNRRAGWRCKMIANGLRAALGKWR